MGKLCDGNENGDAGADGSIVGTNEKGECDHEGEYDVEAGVDKADEEEEEEEDEEDEKEGEDEEEEEEDEEEEVGRLEARLVPGGLA